MYQKYNASTLYAYRIERCVIYIEFILKQNSNKWKHLIGPLPFLTFKLLLHFFYIEGFLFLNDIFDFCIFPLIYLMLYCIKRLHTFNCLSTIRFFMISESLLFVPKTCRYMQMLPSRVASPNSLANLQKFVWNPWEQQNSWDIFSSEFIFNKNPVCRHVTLLSQGK